MHALTTSESSGDAPMDTSLPPAQQANGFGTTYGGATQVPTSVWGGNSVPAVTDASAWGVASPTQQTPQLGGWSTTGAGQTSWGGNSSYGNGS